jgi:hypothetical protein
MFAQRETERELEERQETRDKREEEGGLKWNIPPSTTNFALPVKRIGPWFAGCRWSL